MKQALDLIFPKQLIREPIIYQLGQEIPIVFNIRRAKVNEKAGEIVLELEGEEADLARATAWLSSRGVRVEPVTHDTLES